MLGLPSALSATPRLGCEVAVTGSSVLLRTREVKWPAPGHTLSLPSTHTACSITGLGAELVEQMPAESSREPLWAASGSG